MTHFLISLAATNSEGVNVNGNRLAVSDRPLISLGALSQLKLDWAAECTKRGTSVHANDVVVLNIMEIAGE